MVPQSARWIWRRLLVFSTHPNPNAVYVWRSDFTEWRTAGEIPEFNRFILRPPPLPVKSAPSAPSYEPEKMPEPVRERERTPEASAPSKAGSILGIVASIAAWVVGAAFG